MAKRSGPLVAVIVSPADPDAAERLLAQVSYQAEITRDEYVPTRRDNIGDLVINTFILIGILLAFRDLRPGSRWAVSGPSAGRCARAKSPTP